MGQIHKENWMQYLPWALLGTRTAFDKYLGTSTLGTDVPVPGCILLETVEEPNIQVILEKLQIKNNSVYPYIN